jgi:5'-nucleotidase
VRIFVTNDDGARAPGLAALSRGLSTAFPDTVIAVPLTDCGGCGTSIRPDSLSSVNGWPEVESSGNHALVFLAPPARIILAAGDGVFGAIPDVVVVGINHGPNAGRTILHSGTVGAALTAATMGISALAISLDDVYSTGGREDSFMHWGTAEATVLPLVRWLARADPGTVLNVNVPNRELPRIRGVRVASPAPSWPERRFVAAGRQILPRPGICHSPRQAPADSDVALLAAGYVTVTSLGSFTGTTIDAGPAVRWLNDSLSEVGDSEHASRN